jgi:hydrogenase nickel incorporation protein HypA/HybF
MHELSIAQSVLDIVHQHVPAGEEKRVRIIRLSIGTMAGVVADSLAFCFSAITQGTPFEGAVLEIAQIPLTAHCNTCEANAPIDRTRFICPACGGSDLTVVSGREMQVREIELNDQTGNPP